MEDTREVSAELHRLADTGPNDHFDTTAVLVRGRRSLRRRRFLGAGGAVAGVAAAALAVTLIPNLAGVGNDPGVAGGTDTENSQFSAVPGIPRGEDGAGQRISEQEAVRRCALRYPGMNGSMKEKSGFRSVSSRVYLQKARGGGAPEELYCTIPGGDKPSAELVAAAKADPFPNDTAGKLRNCSVDAWVDMTKWHILVSDRLNAATKSYPGFSREQLIAVSPSGKTAISCGISADPRGGVGYGWAVTGLRLDDLGADYPRMQRPDGTFVTEIGRITVQGKDCGPTAGGLSCGQSLPVGWGHAPANTAKVVVQVGSGPAYDAPFKDGWYTFTALDKTRHTMLRDPLTVRAYDKDGKLLSKLYPEK
ncbi:hypothetical protein [Kribbella sp. NPDC055071]